MYYLTSGVNLKTFVLHWRSCLMSVHCKYQVIGIMTEFTIELLVLFQSAVLLFPVLFWRFVLICHVMLFISSSPTVSCPFHCVHLCLVCQLLYSLCAACCLLTGLFCSPESVLCLPVATRVTFLFLFVCFSFYSSWFSWFALFGCFSFCVASLDFGILTFLLDAIIFHILAGYQSSLYVSRPAQCLPFGYRPFCI